MPGRGIAARRHNSIQIARIYAIVTLPGDHAGNGMRKST